MARYSNTLNVTNDTGQPRVIWIEPWGGDFTLPPGQTFEIVGHDPVASPAFSVVLAESGTQIFIEVADPASGDYDVFLDGVRLAAGLKPQ